ncbi:MAG: hypothetical protein Q8K51_10695 [Nitrospirota bacterium]|nr:hypothetical protein [Nitrospirota bacterium]
MQKEFKMQNSTLKEIKFKLPSDIANSVSKKEIVGLLAEKASGKAEYYRSKCKEMEEKHGTDFKSFKKKVESSGENFSRWDDLLVWEGYELAYKEWKKKYEELRDCME